MYSDDLDVGSVKPLDRVLEAVAADDAHGIERPAVGVRPQSIYRYDARVFEAACDLCFQQKPRSDIGMMGVAILNLLTSTTSRCSSSSLATKTSPSPPLACGRSTRNRKPLEVGVPAAAAPGTPLPIVSVA